MKRALWCLLALALANCGEGDSEPEEPLPEVTVEVTGSDPLCSDARLALKVRITATRAVVPSCNSGGVECTGTWGSRVEAGSWEGEVICDVPVGPFSSPSVYCAFEDAEDGRYAEGQDWGHSTNGCLPG